MHSSAAKRFQHFKMRELGEPSSSRKASIPFLLRLLFLLPVADALAQEPSTTGFISIDCGLDADSSYPDQETGIVYSSDKFYISTGENGKVPANINLTSPKKYHETYRSFPDGARNCYSLGPVQPNMKYRVKAEFYYFPGNPTFDVYIGVNFWKTIDSFYKRIEIIMISDSDSIQICLINRGFGTPYISELDLRPVPFSMYNMLINSSYAIIFETNRINYGAKDTISFPYDIYDRGWHPILQGKIITTTKRISTPRSGNFFVPQAVLETASEAKSLSDSLNITATDVFSNVVFLYMYFVEFETLGINETREFSIYLGNELVYGPFRPSLLQQDVVLTSCQDRSPRFFIRSTSNSTLPPVISAVEIFSIIRLPLLPTKSRDVKAMLALKKEIPEHTNWEGDPCVPREFIWKGLECDYDPSMFSRIISLDLSFNGLTGGIPLSIANLSSLSSLDLSYNSLTGEIPSYFGSLTALQLLNLEGNNLTGTVPITIYERSINGSLVLRIKNNPYLCQTSDQCISTEFKKKKQTVKTPIIISVAILVLVCVLLTVCVRGRRRIVILLHEKRGILRIKRRQDLSMAPTKIPQSRQYSEAEIENITNNFNQPIGRGSSGIVYLGSLLNGTQVAVKVLFNSVHGERQFRAEAELLSRLHHRNLVSLLGYSYESMALIYQYVPQGSLADHLSGDSANSNILNWSVRLNIAVEVSEGLEYLHHSCSPPVVHRDVKTSNILLTENFSAKLADFGFSKSFNFQENNYVSTIIAGTPGYLDPEYQQTNLLSEKSDIYSFGVVLLALVTGRPPISKGKNVTHIADEVRSEMERGTVADIVDPRMHGTYNVNAIRKVIEIALSCASVSSNQRPTMSEVLDQLRDCLDVESATDIRSRSLALDREFQLATDGPSA